NNIMWQYNNMTRSYQVDYAGMALRQSALLQSQQQHQRYMDSVHKYQEEKRAKENFRLGINLTEAQMKEREQLMKAETERQEKERIERERIKNERQERERQERERQERERQEREKSQKQENLNYSIKKSEPSLEPKTEQCCNMCSIL